MKQSTTGICGLQPGDPFEAKGNIMSPLSWLHFVADLLSVRLSPDAKQLTHSST
jgi:hypothetical protein